jgi:hypothetical protein
LFTVSPSELGFTPLILLRAAAAFAPPSSSPSDGDGDGEQFFKCRLRCVGFRF